MREWLNKNRTKCWIFWLLCWGLLAVMVKPITALYYGMAVMFLFLMFFGEDVKD